MDRPGSLIAEGSTAEIYAWGEDAILKLYRTGYPPAEAEQEAARIEAVCAAGVTTPAVREHVALNGRTGLVLERVHGDAMMTALVTKPEQARPLAEQMAAVHADLHARTAPQLPHKHERMRAQIERATGPHTRVRNAALERLNQLPPGTSLCHGDFHPNNILLTAHGPVVIDWVDATQGAPAADIARTRLLMRLSILPSTLDSRTRQQLEAMRQQFFEHYLQRYLELYPIPVAEIKHWELPVAVARLSEGLGDQERLHLATYCTSLVE